MGRINKKANVKITCTDIYYDLQRLYSAYGDDLSHHKFTATVSYRMYVTETISLGEYHFVLQTVAYRVIDLQWATFAYRIAPLIANYVLVHISWRFNAVQKLCQSPIALSQ
jgi:hypothetical protein